MDRYLKRLRMGVIRPAVSGLLAMLVVCCNTIVTACPFCSALAPTLSDDLKESSAAVVAHYVAVSEEADGFPMYRLRVIEVIKGDAMLENSVIEVPAMAELSPKGTFWLVGYGERQIQWAEPKEVTSKSIPYLRSLDDAPESGPKRLEYFLSFLRAEDELVATDAYNEFAEASLSDISQLGDKLDTDWVREQLHHHRSSMRPPNSAGNLVRRPSHH